ncbi:unnamed protein product, partial [Mesorhabditis belari]|uniref:AP3A hydrolase n=1 Tax=Mesorhabditis belari TaxID=2138241 RepID=A0AAF3FG21_9BILA
MHKNAVTLARFLVILLCFFEKTIGKEKSLVLLVSFDGFRHSLLNETTVPNIYKWAKGGTWFVNGTKSQYVTYTAPNHMSIATGLYEESHGIVSNFFFDHKDDTVFDYFNYTGRKSEMELSSRWYLGDPIWLTNDRNGGRSAVMDWPMVEANYSHPPHKPHWFRAWSSDGDLPSWKESVNRLLEQFIDQKTPVNLGMLYLSQPDTVLHLHGFYDGEFEKIMKTLDEAFGYLVESTKALNLSDKLNIILTADHGHAQIKDYKSLFCIRDYVLGGGFEMGDHMIYPLDEAHGQQVFENLTRAINDGFEMEVIWKKDIPINWHYANSTRVGQIILNPKIGSGLSFSCRQKDLEKLYGPVGKEKYHQSTHGMDPNTPEMRALLAMNGPAFKQRTMISQIPNNIDLYPFLCHLLNVPPSPNNGSISLLKDALQSETYSDEDQTKQPPKSFDQNHHSTFYWLFTDSLGFLVFLVPSICIVVLIFGMMWKNMILKNDPNWARPERIRGYRPLNLENDDDNDEESQIGVSFSRRDDPTGEGHVNLTTKKTKKKKGGLLEAVDTSDEDI